MFNDGRTEKEIEAIRAVAALERGDNGEKYTFDSLDWSSAAYKFLDNGERTDCNNRAMWQRLKRRFLEQANNRGFLGVRDWLLDEIYTSKPDMRESGVLYDLFHVIFDSYNADTLDQCREYLVNVVYSSQLRASLAVEPLQTVVSMQAPTDEDAFSMIFQAWLNENHSKRPWQVKDIRCAAHGNKLREFRNYLGDIADDLLVKQLK